VNITLDAAATAAAADLNTLDVRTTGLVTATGIAAITGTLADALNATDDQAALDTADNVNITLDAAATAAAADLNTLDVRTTGLVNATGIVAITGTLADALNATDDQAALDTADNVNITLDAAATAAAADLNTLDSRTGGLLTATGIASITGTAGHFATLLNGLNTAQVTLSSNFNAFVTGTSTVAQVNTVDNITTGTVIADDITDNFSAIAGASTVLIDGATAVTANGTAAANIIDLSMFTAVRGIIINANGGNDTITGSSGNDVINGGVGTVTVIARDGNDTITAGSGADNLDGGAGDDIFIIAAAADHALGETIVGGTGNDTIRFTSTTLNETLTLRADVTDEDGVINVVISDAAGVTSGTTALNVTAAALAGALRVNLTGNDGDNILTGTANADTINGGAGNDRIIADDADTSVDGGAGADTLALALSATFTAAELANVEGVELAEGANLTVDYTDVSGTNNIQVVRGAAGGADENLIVIGASTGAGAWLLDFSLLNLTDAVLQVQGGTDAEDILGTAGADIINGGDGNDTITGGAGADNLNGGADDDVFIIAAAADHAAGETIEGGTGNDTIRFTSTTATVTLTLGADVTDVDGLINVVISDAAGVTSGTTALNVTAAALAGALRVNLTGNDGDNILTGTANQDTISGGNGNDEIIGGAGGDNLTGGAGNDVYVYNGTGDVAAGEVIIELAGGGTDRIKVTATTDFSANMVATNFDHIEELEITGATTATFIGEQLTNRTITLFGDAGANQEVVVTATAGAITDLSNMSVDGSWTVGQDTITINGGAGDETIIGTATNDAINGGDGADNITGGDGEDSINGGAGADTITLTEGASARDTITLANLSTTDTIIGFNVAAGDATEDLLVFDFSEIEGAGDYVYLDDGVSLIGHTDLIAFTTITGPTDLAAATANSNILIANFAGNIATPAGLETTLEDGGFLALTTNQAWAIGSTFLVAYDDGVNTYIAKVVVGGDGALDNETFAPGELTATVLVQLNGIADVTTLATTNFGFIA
jgi:Ca2+-binding RTX toxin-like protein